MNNKAGKTPNHKLVMEAADLMLRLDPEPGHSKQVARLALQLFDQLQDVHELGAGERDILEAAAFLHDIGWSVSGQQHHKHSAQLIEEHNWRNATPDQVNTIAAIARYHRKALPKSSHRIYARLKDELKTVVNKLAAIIRVADGLDRGHQDKVEKVEVQYGNEECMLKVLSREPCTLEIWGAERKKAFFEEIYNTSLKIELVS